jgi:hypothetical protein
MHSNFMSCSYSKAKGLLHLRGATLAVGTVCFFNRHAISQETSSLDRIKAEMQQLATSRVMAVM